MKHAQQRRRHGAKKKAEDEREIERTDNTHTHTVRERESKAPTVGASSLNTTRDADPSTWL